MNAQRFAYKGHQSQDGGRDSEEHHQEGQTECGLPIDPQEEREGIDCRLEAGSP